jgi:hypothetical protein
MRAKTIIAAGMLITAMVFGAAPAASAAGAALLAGGDIAVGDDLGGCATVSFPTNTTFAGQFTAVGEVQGPGTRVGTIRGAIPFANVKATGNSWSGCISGAYAGATAGEVKYTLTASGANGGEIVYVVQCAVTNGTVSCV